MVARFRLVLLGLLLSQPLSACMCGRIDVATAVKQAHLVFRGKVVGVTYLDPKSSAIRRYGVTLQVSDVWKGDVKRRVVVYSSDGASDCDGFWKDVGKDLMVFANRHIVRGNGPDYESIPIWTDRFQPGHVLVFPAVCSLTGEVKNATDSLLKLGRPAMQMR